MVVVADFMNARLQSSRSIDNRRVMDLRPAKDEHFAAMIDGRAPSPSLSIPPSGVECSAILELIRCGAADMRACGVQGSWMMVADDEVLGLCCFKGVPSAVGVVEIGNGVPPAL